jgi:hypothetical protein
LAGSPVMWAVTLGLSGAGGPAAEGVGRAGNFVVGAPLADRDQPRFEKVQPAEDQRPAGLGAAPER